jgi:hypothetical protein
MSNQVEAMRQDGINGGGGIFLLVLRLCKNLLSYYSIVLAVDVHPDLRQLT